MVACYDEHSIAQISNSGSLIQTLRPKNPKTMIGPNDFAHDQRGGVYFSASGVFDPKAPFSGKIFYLDPSLQLTEVANNIHYSNGLSVSPDQKFLIVSEHFKNRLLKYPISSPGKLSTNRASFNDLTQSTPTTQNYAPGYLGPDGIRLGIDQTFYIAQYGGARVLHQDLDGQYLNEIKIHGPYTHVTNIWPGKNSQNLSIVRDPQKQSHPEVLHRINEISHRRPEEVNCSLKL